MKILQNIMEELDTDEKNSWYVCINYIIKEQ